MPFWMTTDRKITPNADQNTRCIGLETKCYGRFTQPSKECVINTLNSQMILRKGPFV